MAKTIKRAFEQGIITLKIDDIIHTKELDILLHNYWTVMDDELIEELSELPDMKKATIENTILNYYSKNDFEKIDKQKENEHYSKYRNKILHGEELGYGTIENMIRSWLELIFLFDLRKNYRDNERKNDD